MKRLPRGGVEQAILMKTLFFTLATLTAGVDSAHAELFSPSVLPGAVIGGVAGAVIGNNAGGHHGGSDGAVIGAIAGGLIGAAVDHSRPADRYYVPASAPACPPPVTYYVAPAPRVVYAPPARTVYVAPRREVVVVRRDYDHRGYPEHRYERDYRRDNCR